MDSRKLVLWAENHKAHIAIAVILLVIGLVAIYNQLNQPSSSSHAVAHVDDAAVYKSNRQESEVVYNPDAVIAPAKKALPPPPVKKLLPPPPEVKPVEKTLPPALPVLPKDLGQKFLPASVIEGPAEEEFFISEQYAPFGNLLECQLVATIDSSNMKTPVIAQVVTDLWHEGKLIIPAGVEIHGFAGSANRDRIECQNEWVLVWKDLTPDNGKELTVTGLALDCTRVPGTNQFGITDMSAGLRGHVVKNEDLRELVAMAMVFLSGAASGYADSLQTNYYMGNGVVVSGTQDTENAQMKQAISEGVKAAAEVYAQRMLDSIQKDGAFIRVPAGKTFYVHVEQTIDLRNARIGGTEFEKLKKKKEMENKLQQQQLQQNVLRLRGGNDTIPYSVSERIQTTK